MCVVKCNENARERSNTQTNPLAVFSACFLVLGPIKGIAAFVDFPRKCAICTLDVLDNRDTFQRMWCKWIFRWCPPRWLKERTGFVESNVLSATYQCTYIAFDFKIFYDLMRSIKSCCKRYLLIAINLLRLSLTAQHVTIVCVPSSCEWNVNMTNASRIRSINPGTLWKCRISPQSTIESIKYRQTFYIYIDGTAEQCKRSLDYTYPWNYLHTCVLSINPEFSVAEGYTHTVSIVLFV